MPLFGRLYSHWKFNRLQEEARQHGVEAGLNHLPDAHFVALIESELKQLALWRFGAPRTTQDSLKPAIDAAEIGLHEAEEKLRSTKHHTSLCLRRPVMPGWRMVLGIMTVTGLVGLMLHFWRGSLDYNHWALVAGAGILAFIVASTHASLTHGWQQWIANRKAQKELKKCRRKLRRLRQMAHRESERAQLADHWVRQQQTILIQTYHVNRVRGEAAAHYLDHQAAAPPSDRRTDDLSPNPQPATVEPSTRQAQFNEEQIARLA